jgi:hypothetical protein
MGQPKKIYYTDAGALYDTDRKSAYLYTVDEIITISVSIQWICDRRYIDSTKLISPILTHGNRLCDLKGEGPYN